jgi:putative transposase
MPNYDPNLHHRRSIRLKGYDYRQEGVYCVTICTYRRECILGMVRESGEMVLSEFGMIVQEEWLQTAVVRPNIDLDAFIVMPNHIHGIVVITKTIEDVGANRRFALTNQPNGTLGGSLGAIMQQFKSIVTKRINKTRNTPTSPVWQRNYYEQIIRNEQILNNFRYYIDSNPEHWALDRYHKEIV